MWGNIKKALRCIRGVRVRRHSDVVPPVRQKGAQERKELSVHDGVRLLFVSDLVCSLY